MLKIIATATLSAICRDLGPLSSAFRWLLAPLCKTCAESRS